jgi:hypothetical protein
MGGKVANLLALTALLAASAAQAQPMYTGGNRPVMLIADGDGLPPCTPAMIMDSEAGAPAGGGGIMVFPGDSTDLDFHDTLVDGDPVWLCEVSDDMAAIVYSPAPGEDCELDTPDGVDRPYLGPCDWGWVKAEWVSVVSP